jgi:PleD family two-component response regulator
LGEQDSIAMVDIDHFKRFNDTFGHDVGDQVLRMVASRIAKVGGNGQAFRCGGEEFAILFPSAAREAFEHAEALRQIIEQTPFVVRGPDRSVRRRKERRYKQAKRALRPASLRTSVTVSIGIAEPGDATFSPEAVLRAADRALYQAKNSGRNRVEVYQHGRARDSVTASDHGGGGDASLMPRG